MANTILYPYGISGETEISGIWTQKVAELQSVANQLAPLAFRDTPNYPNPVYTDVCIFPSANEGVAVIRYGNTNSVENYLMSPIFELGEIGDNITLTFSAGASYSGDRYPGLVFFDENLLPYGYNVASSNPRTVTKTVSQNYKYVRLIFKTTYVFQSYILDAYNQKYLFKGDELDLSLVQGKEAFRNSNYWKSDWEPNSRGDWIGWNFTDSSSAASDFRSNFNYPMYRNIGVNATQFPYSISKMVELPATGLDIEFSCGEVNTDAVLRVLNPVTKAAAYYTANENPRTISALSGSYTHVQLYFLTENYANCYIKDATNNEILWEGAATTE